jgi:hypothetical protein
VKVSKSDYYRNEMDIKYKPPAAMQYGVNMNLIEYIPHQIRNSFVSMLSLFRKKPASGQKRREFPVDDLADRLDPSTEEKREFWKKDFGVIMTHDVDTRVGYEYGMSKFVEMERAEDMVSTFNIVAESFDYEISQEFIKTLTKDGFDFGMHGLHHDAKFPFLQVTEQKERIERSAVRSRELGLSSLGYRAPLLHRTKTMIQHLTDAGYDWDSSFPDTDDSTVGYAATGSRTIFPFYPLYRDGGGCGNRVLSLRYQYLCHRTGPCFTITNYLRRACSEYGKRRWSTSNRRGVLQYSSYIQILRILDIPSITNPSRHYSKSSKRPTLKS